MINVLSKKFPGAETILVVEDEELLRDMVHGILEGCGYNVLEAESGRKAFDIWNAGKGQINLLLTDIVLPDFEQADLARMGARMLQKPYDQHGLVHLVREMLGGTESSSIATASAA
jgi:CheY-like chemotaxis protein